MYCLFFHIVLLTHMRYNYMQDRYSAKFEDNIIGEENENRNE